MNENIKTFSLVVITICVFVMTVIDILNLIDQKTAAQNSYSSYPSHQPPSAKQNLNSNAPKTTMKFAEMSFDFGDITEGDIMHHSFAFTNTGSNPLIITDAVGSCGCTVPTYPKEPIAPGASATIEVQFNSAGKKDMQDKTVTLTVNTDPPSPEIHIHANVQEKK